MVLKDLSKSQNGLKGLELSITPTDVGTRLVPSRRSVYKLYVSDHEVSSPKTPRIRCWSEERADDFHWSINDVACCYIGIMRRMFVVCQPKRNPKPTEYVSMSPPFPVARLISAIACMPRIPFKARLVKF